MPPVNATPLTPTVFFFARLGDMVMITRMLNLLHRHGVAVDFPEQQNCCGLPVAMAAEEETAVELARQNVEAFAHTPCDYIVTLCASCASHIKHAYPGLARGLGMDPAEAEGFVQKVIDFSSFVIDVLKLSADAFAAGGRKVAYHAPCHLCRGLNVSAAPRRLIATAGHTYVPSIDEDVCCGFGGSYSVDFPEISAAILDRKLDTVEASGADFLVTDCPGCVLQLRGGMDKRNRPIDVRHIVELMVGKR